MAQFRFNFVILAVVSLGAAIVVEILVSILRLEMVTTPLAFPDFVLPCIRAAVFVADNVIDYQDLAGVARYGPIAVFSHDSPVPECPGGDCIGGIE